MNRVIDRFSSSYTYQRPAPGSYVNGRWAEGTEAPPVTFWASIQPITGRMMLLLPESERTTEQIYIFTETALTPMDEPNDQPADIVSYGGRNWQVQNRENWNLNDYPHFVFRAKLVEQD